MDFGLIVGSLLLVVIFVVGVWIVGYLCCC